MKIKSYPYILMLVVFFATPSMGGLLDGILKIDRSIPEINIGGKTVPQVSENLINIFSGMGYSLNDQGSNLVKFTRAYTGLSDWLAYSTQQSQHEELICSITKTGGKNVKVQCRSYHIATNAHGVGSRDEQTHVKKIRKRIKAAFEALK